MSLYSITYYLSDNHHNESDDLSRKIKSLGGWAQILPSVWLVNTSLSSEEITDSLTEVMNSADLLFVSNVNENNSGKLHPGALEWIKSRVDDSKK